MNKKIVILVSFLIGSSVIFWLTLLQAEFLHSIGVSKWAAIAIEPSLVLVSLLLGFKISKGHRFVSFILLVLLFVVSLVATSSLYTRHLFTEIEQQKVNTVDVKSSRQNEKVMRDALDELVHRGASSKTTLAIMSKLESQQQITQEKAKATELSSIVRIIVVLSNMEPDKALIGFALLISCTTVSIPSFCFFSIGLLLKEEKQEDTDEDENPDEVPPTISKVTPEYFIGDVKSKLTVDAKKVKDTLVSDTRNALYLELPKLRSMIHNDIKKTIIKRVKLSLRKDVVGIEKVLTTSIKSKYKRKDNDKD